MTEDELDRIKKSFVRSSDECPMEVACLLTVMKYYGGQQDARTLAEWCKVDGKYTLMGMKQAAIRAGMEAEICLQKSSYQYDLQLNHTCENQAIPFSRSELLFALVYVKYSDAVFSPCVRLYYKTCEFH